MRLLRFLIAVVRYRDFAYARRLLGRAASNLRQVGGALGAHYVRIRPYEDFGGVSPGRSCERLVLGEQPAGLVRVNLVAYHLALPDAAGKVVVDAGANEGAGAALFAGRAARVIAFDVSPEAVAAARQRYAAANLEFHVHDATRPFPVAPGSVDVVFSSEVIEHLRDGPGFLRSAAQALKPGGLLLLKTPNDAYNRLENRLNSHHVNPYDRNRLEREVRAEFESVEISGLTYDVSIVRSVEERPDPAPPEAMPYSFGEPVDVDRIVTLRMRVTPRRVQAGASEPPEYLWVRASKGRPDGGQEGDRPRR